jgi:nitroreductase
VFYFAKILLIIQKHNKMPKVKNTKNIFPIHPLIVKRWSTRSFNSDKKIAMEDIYGLIEAARWAPSAFNEQPWRFIVTEQGDPRYKKVTESLAEFNQLWAPLAPVLIVVAGETKRGDGAPNHTYAYDCGQAVSYLTMEATHRDLMVHQMSGFDKKLLHKKLNLNKDLDVLVVIALGYYQDSENLPEPIRSMELAERVRKSREDIML